MDVAAIGALMVETFAQLDELLLAWDGHDASISRFPLTRRQTMHGYRFRGRTTLDGLIEGFAVGEQ